jgi:hypothetical protein
MGCFLIGRLPVGTDGPAGARSVAIKVLDLITVFPPTDWADRRLANTLFLGDAKICLHVEKL